MRLALPRLSASIMISCSISHLFSGAGCDCRTNASQAAGPNSSNRNEDLAVGEVAGGLRGDRDVKLLGHLFGQFGVRATREEHQILAVVGPVGAQLCALAGRGSIRANRT